MNRVKYCSISHCLWIFICTWPWNGDVLISSGMAWGLDFAMWKVYRFWGTKRNINHYNGHLCGNVFVFVADSEWSLILGEIKEQSYIHVQVQIWLGGQAKCGVLNLLHSFLVASPACVHVHFTLFVGKGFIWTFTWAKYVTLEFRTKASINFFA